MKIHYKHSRNIISKCTFLGYFIIIKKNNEINLFYKIKVMYKKYTNKNIKYRHIFFIFYNILYDLYYTCPIR